MTAPAKPGTGAPPSAGEPGPLDSRFRVFNWVGIIHQLSTTRANQLLRDIPLPWPQFVMLSHLTKRPDEARTVMRIAAALQQNQPAVSKTLAALMARGAVRMAENPADARSKLVRLTPQGRQLYDAAVVRLMPYVGQAFDGWTDPEIAQLFALLDRLKIWLDENR